MKLGIDLDGVVYDSEKDFRIYSELFDMIDLKQNSKIDNKKLAFQERFNWTEEQIEQFLKKYHEKIIKESNYMPGAKDILKMLKDDGHELIVITARGGLNKKMIDISKEKIKKDKMDIFDKYYFATENKDEVCENEQIDIMIEDTPKNCIKIANKKIKTIYLKDAPSIELEENEYIKTLYNWGEIYRYIKERCAKLGKE